MNASNLELNEKYILDIAAVYHDIIFDPRKTDNEENSNKVFRENYSPTETFTPENIIRASEIILDTKERTNKNKLCRYFNRFDCDILYSTEFSKLLEYEKQIMKEYQFCDYSVYKEKRIKFLEKFNNDIQSQSLGKLIEYVKYYTPKIGIYTGSFNPFHIGHYDILQKAEKMFDKVIIAKGINPAKEESENNIDLPFHQVETFNGLLTDYVKSKTPVADYFIVKGLRNGYDLDYEFNQLRWIENLMKSLSNKINVVYIPCSLKYSHISSSSIRGLQKLGTDVSEFIFKWER